MKRSPLPWILIVLAALGAIVGAGLRIYQLTHCMTSAGLIVPGSRILYGMLGFAAIGASVISILCSKLNGAPGNERAVTGSAGCLFVELAAAVAVFYGSLQCLLDLTAAAGSFAALLRGAGFASLLLPLGGMIAAGLLAATALLYGRGTKTTFWFLLLACVFYAAQLIADFKQWSTDPLVIDFCFRLLARVCGMLALFHISGFPLSAGRKRLTVFWSVGAFVFTGMMLPDLFLGSGISLGELLLQVGLTAWCAVHALLILRPSVQAEQPAPEDDAQIEE